MGPWPVTVLFRTEAEEPTPLTVIPFFWAAAIVRIADLLRRAALIVKEHGGAAMVAYGIGHTGASTSCGEGRGRVFRASRRARVARRAAGMRQRSSQMSQVVRCLVEPAELFKGGCGESRSHCDVE
jgi:hypothetical protein